jgi:hypothetical protein
MNSISLESFQDDSFNIKSFINNSLSSLDSTSDGGDATTLLYSLMSLGDKLSDDINYDIKFPSTAISHPNDLLVLDGSFEIDPCFADLQSLHNVKDNMIRTKEALKEAENWSISWRINSR